MKQRKANHSLAFIFITMLIDTMGLGIIIPVLPTLLQHLTGCTLSEAARYGGLLMLTYSLMQFICAPILGGLSDRFGRRPILLTSLLSFGLDYILLGFAPNIAWLFIGRFIAGITGASFTVASAYIADISTPEKRIQNFGLIGAAFGLGFIIGPAIGGILAGFGERIPFFAAAVLSLLNFLYGYFLIPESLDVKNRRKFEWKRANPIGTWFHLRRYPIVIRFGITFLLLNLASQSLQGVWSYYTEYKLRWTEAMVGYSLAFVGIMVALVQGVFNRILVPWLGQNRAILTGLLMYGLGMLIAALADSTLAMFLSVIPLALGGLTGPTVQSILSKTVQVNEQGELQGFVNSIMSLTAIIGPPLMSGLFYYFTSTSSVMQLPGAPYFMSALLVVICFIWTFWILIKYKPN
jgi:DHA1 family tetracycline resistance protein-like MFS transporter